MDHRIIKTLLTTVVQGPNLGSDGDYSQYLCEHGGTHCDLLSIGELLMAIFDVSPCISSIKDLNTVFQVNKLTWPLALRLMVCESELSVPF